MNKQNKIKLGTMIINACFLAKELERVVTNVLRSVSIAKMVNSNNIKKFVATLLS